MVATRAVRLRGRRSRSRRCLLLLLNLINRLWVDHNLDGQECFNTCASVGEWQLPVKSSLKELVAAQSDSAQVAVWFQEVAALDSEFEGVLHAIPRHSGRMMPLWVQLFIDHWSLEFYVRLAWDLADAVWVRLANPVRIA